MVVVVVVVDDHYGILSNKCINIHESILWNAAPQLPNVSHLEAKGTDFTPW